jgi:hypothetical protein
VKKLMSTVALFGSLSTLLCCALPALFVALGMGAVFAGIVSNVPQLIWISQHKVGLFVAAGVLLAIAGYLQWRARAMSCPIDPGQAEACRTARGWSYYIYIGSLVLYGIGAFFAFLAPLLFT